MTTQRSLAAITILRGVSPADLERLAATCRWHVAAKGHEIVGAETQNTDVWFVTKGRVRVTIYAPSGREVSLRDLGRGLSFGELAAIDGAARSASVIALEDSVLAALPRQAFLCLLRDQHSVTLQVLEVLTSMIRDLTTRIVTENTLTVPERVRGDLVRRAQEAGVARNRAHIVPFPTHADLATRIGGAREHVTRELNSLARAGLIELHRGSVIILDFKKLLQLTEDAG